MTVKKVSKTTQGEDEEDEELEEVKPTCCQKSCKCCWAFSIIFSIMNMVFILAVQKPTFDIFIYFEIMFPLTIPFIVTNFLNLLMLISYTCCKFCLRFDHIL